MQMLWLEKITQIKAPNGCDYELPVCQQSWKLTAVAHIQLSQDVLVPGWILFFAAFALQILSGKVIPPIDVQDLAHGTIKSCRSKSVLTTVWADADKRKQPHL